MWFDVLKRNIHPLALLLQDSTLFMDEVTYKDPKFPLGRPVDMGNGEAFRIFIVQDEYDWQEKSANEGKPKGPDNPYYAPKHGGPDNYADVTFDDDDIVYVAGSKKFFNMLKNKLEEY